MESIIETQNINYKKISSKYDYLFEKAKKLEKEKVKLETKLSYEHRTINKDKLENKCEYTKNGNDTPHSPNVNSGFEWDSYLEGSFNKETSNKASILKSVNFYSNYDKVHSYDTENMKCMKELGNLSLSINKDLNNLEQRESTLTSIIDTR